VNCKSLQITKIFSKQVIYILLYFVLRSCVLPSNIFLTFCTYIFAKQNLFVS
jgi:hypothetical protein